jgi:hypothetical protein
MGHAQSRISELHFLRVSAVATTRRWKLMWSLFDILGHII